MLLIFCFNPSGFAIFGSETIGGRFYFQIALGFFTLLFFSKLRISEKDAKIWFYGLIVALFVQFLISLTGVMEVDSGESKVRYFLTTAAPLLLLLLSRYSLSQMVSLSWRFFVASFLAGAVVYSGKRTSVGHVSCSPEYWLSVPTTDFHQTLYCTVLSPLPLIPDENRWFLKDSPKRKG